MASPRSTDGLAVSVVESQGSDGHYGPPSAKNPRASASDRASGRAAVEDLPSDRPARLLTLSRPQSSSAPAAMPPGPAAATLPGEEDQPAQEEYAAITNDYPVYDSQGTQIACWVPVNRVPWRVDWNDAKQCHGERWCWVNMRDYSWHIQSKGKGRGKDTDKLNSGRYDRSTSQGSRSVPYHDYQNSQRAPSRQWANTD